MTERAAASAGSKSETHSGTSFDASIVLRPRTLDETLDLALTYLRVSFWQFARLFGLLTVISGAGLITASIFFELDFWASATLVLALSPILERVVTVYAGRHIFRNDPRIGSSILAVLKRLPVTIVLAFLVTGPWLPMVWTKFDDSGWVALSAVIGSFWPFVLASHVHLAEVILLEQLPFYRAAKRARVLILYRFARALGLVAMSVIIRGGFAGGLELSVRFLMAFVLQFGGVGDAIGGWPALIGYLLAGQYMSVARMFDYVDARTRREGWDIQVRFNAIAQNAQETEARRHAA